MPSFTGHSSLADENCIGDLSVRVSELVERVKTYLKGCNGTPEWIQGCEKLLTELNEYLNPSTPCGEAVDGGNPFELLSISSQELLEIAGGCELLEVVVQFAGFSQKCEDGVTTLVSSFVCSLDAREMFTVIFEVMNFHTKPSAVHNCLPLLHGLALVYGRIKRRKAEFFKEGVPGLLKIGRVALEVDADWSDSEGDLVDLDYPAISQYWAPQELSSKLVKRLINLGSVMREASLEEDSSKVRDVFVLYTFRLLALVSCKDVSEDDVPEAIMEILKLISNSNLSLEKFSVRQLDKILNCYSDDDETEVVRTRLETRVGAALSVYWYLSTHSLGSTQDALKRHIEKIGRERTLHLVNTGSMLFLPLGWKEEKSFYRRGLTLINRVLGVFESVSFETDEFSRGDSSFLLLTPALKTIQDFIVRIGDRRLRQEGYALLVKVVRRCLSPEERFEALYEMVTNCDHPSLASLLLTVVKDECSDAWPKASTESIAKDGARSMPSTTAANSTVSSRFVSSQVLQFIQCALRAKNGGPVELPDNLDPVLSALNLYRFLLLRETSGDTNFTQVLSHEELAKGKAYWLLPTLEQAQRVLAALEGDEDAHLSMALNCVLSVLHRCLEIVEDLLKYSRILTLIDNSL